MEGPRLYACLYARMAQLEKEWNNLPDDAPTEQMEENVEQTDLVEDACSKLWIKLNDQERETACDLTKR